MNNQDHHHEPSRYDERGQHGRDDWDQNRDWQGSRGRGPYQDQDDYRSRGEQGGGGQGNYDPSPRGGRHQGGWSGERPGQSGQNYRSERGQYDSGYAQGGQGGYQEGGYQQGGYQRGGYGGGYDRGQGQYGSNQRGYQQSGHQGSSWDQGGSRGMQGGYESGQSHRGRGPKNYQRSDDRICEDVCDRLSDDHDVDASDIDVSVSNREVTLSGEVDSKQAKRRAEDCADSCSGVEHVQNNLRVKKSQSGRSDDQSDKPKTK